MKNCIVLLILSVFFSCKHSTEKGSLFSWTHFTIDGSLPGEMWGTGGPTLTDYDGDGDLDLALSRRSVQAAFWYEYQNDSTWVRHLIGNHIGLDNTLGTTALDIDQDGWTDIVFGHVWFRNPGTLG